MTIRLALLAAVMAACGVAQAQQVIPRTPEGHPDFQGVWSTKWRTPLERQKEADGAAVVAAEKVPALVAALDDGLKSSGNLSPDVDFDWGPFMPAAGGGFRTSLIMEPADGKRPLTPAAQALDKSVKATRDAAEGPEARGPAERCTRGSGMTPMAISPGNQNRQIIQTPANMVLYTEDIGDVRIIAINGQRRPNAVPSWRGDSIGRWDGDTLVIETGSLLTDASIPPAAAGQPPRKVTERLKFTSPDEIDYTAIIEDAATFTAPMKISILMRRTHERMFEVACHEGNYGLAGILSGARAMETRAAVKAAQAARR